MQQELRMNANAIKKVKKTPHSRRCLSRSIRPFTSEKQRRVWAQRDPWLMYTSNAMLAVTTCITLNVYALEMKGTRINMMVMKGVGKWAAQLGALMFWKAPVHYENDNESNLF